MIRKLHHGTTAQFLVNQELSEPLSVETGIRQGCPLAPLLFLLAAEVLAIAINEDPGVSGLQIPNEQGKQHKFSPFVDDSTVFLQEAKQIPRVMDIVNRFGRISGLQVQPTKSKIIFLNTAVERETYEGIPVLANGESERYLGYAVGTGDMTTENWAGRIRKVQRRLATATQLGTSVENRVTILNVIMLPSVLFTAAVFDMPDWAEKQLRNIQKNFLWQHSTSSQGARHKVNPGLLYTPKQAGGVGLASILVACKTQKMKQAMLWPTQQKDKYLAAWKAWVYRGDSEDWKVGVSPTSKRRRYSKTSKRSPGNALQELIGEWLRPPEEKGPEHSQRRQEVMNQAAEEASSWTVEDEWVIKFVEPVQAECIHMEHEDQDFWPTFHWGDNPWVKDADGNVLTDRKYGSIQQCAIAELQIMRINVKTYSIVIPWTTTKKYSQAKLKRWGVAIIWSAPPLEIGEQLGIKETLYFRLQHLLDLKHQYEWKVVGPGRIQGTPQGEEIKSNENVIFTQQLDGIHWRLEKQHANGGRIQEDRNKLESTQDEGGVVFCAHPLIHGFPWFVPDTVKNKNVVKALKKQPFKKFKGVGVGLTTMIATLKTKAESQRWIAAGLQQTPTELWAHKNELTDYQVWVVYRGVTNQLNLYHAERATDSSCRKTAECAGAKETLEHLFWQCPSAQACWKKLISQWTGEQHDQASMEAYMQYCASRKAPSLPKDRKMDLYIYEPGDEADMETMWKRIWRIASSICITSLWIQRNRVIFEQQGISSDQAMQEFWSSCMRQLRAIAKRERRQTNTRISGTRLQLGTQLLQQKPRETPSKVETRELMQKQKELALLARLQAFQTSCLR